MITNRYLYKLEWGNNTRNVFPIEDGAGIVYEKEDYMAYFRAKFNGSLIFRNDSKSGVFDYNIFKNANWYDVFTLYIYRTSYTSDPIFTGKFRIYDGGFDDDKCTFTVTPEVVDDYSCLIYKGEDEVNIISTVADRYSVFHYSTDDDYETIVLPLPYPVNTSIPTPTSVIYYTGAIFPFGYVVYRTTVVNTSQNTIVTTELRRDVRYTISALNPSTTGSPNWVSDPEGNPQEDGRYKWVRYYNNVDLTMSSPYITTYDGYYLKSSPVVDVIETDRCILLWDIVEVLADNCDLTASSQFFLGSMNYVLDEVGYPPGYNTNPLQGLFILPKSEISDKSDAATKSVITFNDLMRLLYEMFQVKWYVENGVLKIEHESFFDDASNQGEDLTSADYIDYIDASNKYDYQYVNVKSERWKFMEADGVDFVGKEMEYSNLAPNLDMYRDAEIIEHNVDSITTDMDFAFKKPNEISKDGWFMFQTYYDGSSYYVGYDGGIISSKYEQNLHLSVANLQWYYWRHIRPFPVVNLNVLGNLTTVPIFSRKKIKIQKELTVPACDIDVNKLIKTELGWGEVKEATEDFKTRTIKLVIAHYD